MERIIFVRCVSEIKLRDDEYPTAPFFFFISQLWRKHTVDVL